MPAVVAAASHATASVASAQAVPAAPIASSPRPKKRLRQTETSGNAEVRRSSAAAASNRLVVIDQETNHEDNMGHSAPHRSGAPSLQQGLAEEAADGTTGSSRQGKEHRRRRRRDDGGDVAPSLAPNGDELIPRKRKKRRSHVDGSTGHRHKKSRHKALASTNQQEPDDLVPGQPMLRTAVEDLTEVQQLELKESVLRHLHTMCGKTEDAEVLAEFVVVMVTERKTPSEMIKEIAEFHDQAEPFVIWVEKTKEEILARARREARMMADSISDSNTGAVQVGAQSKTPRRAQLRPNPHSGDAPRPGHNGSARVLEKDASSEKRFFVVNDRLVLQPNAQHGGNGTVSSEAAGLGGASSGSCSVAGPAQSPAERKMELLAKMTQQLKGILSKLSTKGLDDDARERFQTMAQSIQMQMASLTNSKQGRP
eukprot:gnl/TRDRNA2_/TRDRNA2_138799_c1_seq1.p1 gnl/TRDRNA2_/TRDRNA2_138799_c1~~gnl/TRDRNA2_/TRDRNA2_138799_c1_seq1.p1  ORF type:complete len:451 (+),score=95.87 gnl/TRDRNA2_/TRDRNA2_138799_c1_seq1:79-1353(+)